MTNRSDPLNEPSEPGVGSSEHTRKVAAFDFDGTVTRRDTLVPFVRGFTGNAASVRATVGTGWSSLVTRNQPLTDRDAFKEQMVQRLLAGRSARELDRAAGTYATGLIDTAFRPEMVDEIRRHVAAGHETLFVSASLSNYLWPVARYLGVTDVVAVELEHRDGVLTGSMVHPNVRAAQKAVRLRNWLGVPPQGPLRGIELWAYGNSSGDHELLELADHAYWLGKEDKRPQGAIRYGPSVGFR